MGPMTRRDDRCALVTMARVDIRGRFECDDRCALAIPDACDASLPGRKCKYTAGWTRLPGSQRSHVADGLTGRFRGWFAETLDGPLEAVRSSRSWSWSRFFSRKHVARVRIRRDVPR